MKSYRIVQIKETGERLTPRGMDTLTADEAGDLKNSLRSGRPLGSSIDYQVIAN